MRFVHFQRIKCNMVFVCIFVAVTNHSLFLKLFDRVLLWIVSCS